MVPKYSICICNYNMEDTLERALPSVLVQLDDDYEVVVIDDGSKDNSIKILDKLAAEYPCLRCIFLPRDRKRKLGFTRNISIQEARGEYVLLHIDTDDLWEPFIKDFVTLFHRIEKCLDREFLLAGQQVNMARRDFLLKHGPYRNIYHTEDRDMWLRLAALDAYVPFDHRIFRARLSRPKKVSFFKTIKDTWAHLVSDFRGGSRHFAYIWDTVRRLFILKKQIFSRKNLLLRSVLVIPAYIVSRFKEPLTRPDSMKRHAEFVAYRDRMRGTYAQLMLRNGCDPDLSFLSPEAQEVFSRGPKMNQN